MLKLCIPEPRLLRITIVVFGTSANEAHSRNQRAPRRTKYPSAYDISGGGSKSNPELREAQPEQNL